MRPIDDTELITIMGQVDNENRLKNKDRQPASAPHHREISSTTSKPFVFTGTCFRCGKTGHKSNGCIKRATPYTRPSDTESTQTKPQGDKKPSTSRPRGSSDLVCSNCKRTGHVEAKCFFKIGFPPKRETSAKQVLFVRTERERNSSPIATASSDNQQAFQCMLDTGAEVSLIHAQIVEQVGAKLKAVHRNIQGIGPNLTKALGSGLITTRLPQIALEVDFLVVPNGTIPAVDAIIGWDIISQPGLQLVKTTSGLDLCYEPNVVPVRSNREEKSWSGLDEQMQRDLDTFMWHIRQITPSQVTTGELFIVLKDPTPVAYRPWPLAYSERQKLKEIIRQQINNEIIQPSQSEYASSIVSVTKRNGDLRLCVDYRELNRKVVKDRYPLPRIQDQIDALSRAKYYMTLDMEAGFHQVPVTTAHTIKALSGVFKVLGKLKRIIADRALAFTSASFKNFLKENEVDLHHIATGMPPGNGQVERVMRTLFDMLRATLHEKGEKNWAKELPMLENNLNHLQNHTTGVSPVLLMKETDERLRSVCKLMPDRQPEELTSEKEQEVLERINSKTNEMIQRFNRNRVETRGEYKIGPWPQPIESETIENKN